jgi:hypothetical protein
VSEQRVGNVEATEVTAVEEETVTYLYGYTVALEPGEAAPEFAKHADVEEADSGWDKVERVHNIAYTTTNQDVAREHGFALLGFDDGTVSYSWGTVDKVHGRASRILAAVQS